MSDSILCSVEKFRWTEGGREGWTGERTAREGNVQRRRNDLQGRESGGARLCKETHALLVYGSGTGRRHFRGFT